MHPKNSMTTFPPTFHLTPQPLHIRSQNFVSIFCSLYRSNLNGAKKKKKPLKNTSEVKFRPYLCIQPDRTTWAWHRLLPHVILWQKSMSGPGNAAQLPCYFYVFTKAVLKGFFACSTPTIMYDISKKSEHWVDSDYVTIERLGILNFMWSLKMSEFIFSTSSFDNLLYTV